MAPSFLKLSCLVIAPLMALISSATSSPNYCPLLGPIYPPPKNLHNNQHFLSVSKNITDTLNQASQSALFSNDSIIVQLFSVDNPNPLTTFSHTGRINDTLGVREVDENTVFRIGSASKLWTMYLFMMENGLKYFHEPVAKYVPELANVTTGDAIDRIRWDQVTIGELASQLAGLPRDYAFNDLSSEATELEEVGFPTLPPSEKPQCGTTQPCNRTQFFTGLKKAHPVVPTASTPIYSNAAFQVLAYALETITGRPYQDLLTDRLVEPLNLTRSFYNTPNTTYGVIPGTLSDSWWDIQAGDETPAGGLYSSAKDMSSIGRAMLNNTLLDQSTTRQWMKPVTHTSSLEYSVGAPWEIYSFQNSRVIDLYTKSGDLGMYSSMTALSPDHGVGFVILAAGENTTATVALASDLVSNALIPGLEEVAKEQAQKRFAGTFALVNNATNSSITVNSDSGPGLKVSNWISNSSDLFAFLKEKYGSSVSVRLYPTGLESSGRISFRAIIQALSTTKGIGPFTRSCSTWVTVDALVYGDVGVDEFVFTVDEQGRATSLSPRAMRVTLPRLN